MVRRAEVDEVSRSTGEDREAAEQRVHVAEAVVHGAGDGRRGRRAADGHILSERGRLDVPVHPAAIEGVGNRTARDVPDGDDDFHEVGRGRWLEGVGHFEHAARSDDAGRGRGGRAEADESDRDATGVDRGRPARKPVRDAPALAQAAGRSRLEAGAQVTETIGRSAAGARRDAGAAEQVEMAFVVHTKADRTVGDDGSGIGAGSAEREHTGCREKLQVHVVPPRPRSGTTYECARSVPRMASWQPSDDI